MKACYMNDFLENQMYATIGRAVSACQQFEFLFVMCVKLVFRQGQAVAVNDIAPLDHNSFRPAVTALLNELKSIIAVDMSFESTLRDFAERRHVLIHRWFIQRGWPPPSDSSQQMELTKFALAVAQDAVDLSSFLAKYVLEWMKRLPELRMLAEEQEKQWAQMFPAARFAFTIEEAPK
jgi:hypothetical protein